jgi:hypothetical protein
VVLSRKERPSLPGATVVDVAALARAWTHSAARARRDREMPRPGARQAIVWGMAGAREMAPLSP